MISEDSQKLTLEFSEVCASSQFKFIFVSSITNALTILWRPQHQFHPFLYLEDQVLESPFSYQSGMMQCS